MKQLLANIVWKMIEPKITDRLLDFYESLVERGQIPPAPNRTIRRRPLADIIPMKRDGNWMA